MDKLYISLPKVMQGVVVLVVFLGVSMQPSKTRAQENADRGEIYIQSAKLLSNSAGWELIALADIQLSPTMRQGLNSGVPLQFIIDIRIKRSQRFWFDKTLLAQQHRYSLVYYELTRHYRLQSQTAGESRNFRSLLAALDRLGHLQGLYIVRPEHFDGTGALYGQLHVRLDDKALPLPLQPLLSSKWKLSSEEFAWSLN